MSTQNYRILVVDDDPDIGIMIKIMLEYKGYSVMVAERADMIDNILRDNSVDLLIMDMLLSGANGIDVCEELKKDPRTTKLPVIMISAHPNARQISLDAGADDFIAKPFDMHDMFSKIGMLLEKKPGAGIAS